MSERLTAWMAPVTAWWHTLSMRERRLLLVGGGLFLIGFLYWGIFQPLTERSALAQSRLNTEKQLLQWTTQSANNIISLRQQTGRVGNQFTMPMNQVVSSTAARFNVELIRTQPRDDMLQVWVSPIAFNDLMNWLVELRTNYGVQVLFLDLERTDKDGMVEVSRLQFNRG